MSNLYVTFPLEKVPSIEFVREHMKEHYPEVAIRSAGHNASRDMYLLWISRGDDKARLKFSQEVGDDVSEGNDSQRLRLENFIRHAVRQLDIG